MMQTPHRVLILKPSALGDIVHALPVLSAFRAAWPKAHLAWVVNRGFAGLLQGHPELDELIFFDRGAFRGRSSAWQAAANAVHWLGQLRKKRFDLVIDLQGLLRTGLMAAFAGCPTRVGFAAAREGSRFAYTHRVVIPNANELHAVERYWHVVEALGAATAPPRWVVPANPSETAAVQAQLKLYPRPWVAVALGAKWLTKRWPTAQFATLLKYLQKQFSGTVIFVGVTEDQPLADQVCPELTGPTLDLTGRTSLPRLIALLKQCDAMVGNDTGPLHLAAALGTPTIAPYTCTKITRHGPYGFFPYARETTVACAGSYLRICPHGTICFQELTAEKFFPIVDEVLHSWRFPR